MTEPTILQGYSYPFARLTDVITYKARQGRTVEFVIEHAGGWAVSPDGPPVNCACLVYVGDNEDCFIHGGSGEDDLLDNEQKIVYNEGEVET